MKLELNLYSLPELESLLKTVSAEIERRYDKRAQLENIAQSAGISVETLLALAKTELALSAKTNTNNAPVVAKKETPAPTPVAAPKASPSKTTPSKPQKKAKESVTRSSVKSDNRKKVAPKYVNPSNPKETWSGRGKKALWLQKALDRGIKLEAFLVKD